MTYYKILKRGHYACHGGTYCYTPGRWTCREPVEPCVSGWHILTADQLSQWLYLESDDELPLEVWECEAENITDAGNKHVAERIRLTRLVGTLDGYDLRWLGTLFAEAVLENADDPRVGDCLNTVRAYCCGMATESNLSAARSAAWSAARSAAWSAAWSAAESAARSAARSAAWSAAESAAWSAAESAAESAQGRTIFDYLGDDAA